MLRTSKLSCGYGKIPILHNLDLEISQGEIFCVMGINGSGKTTLLKTLFGVLPSLQGEILLDGVPFGNIKFKDRGKKLTMLEAEPFAPFSLTVQELFSIGESSSRQKEFDFAFDRFQLQPLFKKDLLELSAGQAKRVWLAHTLSQGSALVFMDEPFLHLDWLQQQNLMETFAIWKREFSTTFVLALHELNLLANLADRLCVLSGSEILNLDLPEKVLTSKSISDLFQFTAIIDKNPIDGSKRVTLGQKK